MNFTVADELEARLAPVNQETVLRKSPTVPVAEATDGKEMDRPKRRSILEKARRGDERRHVARISRLFRASNEMTWSRKDIFSLGELLFRIDRWDGCSPNPFTAALFLLYGPTAFPPGFVKVRNTVPGL